MKIQNLFSNGLSFLVSLLMLSTLAFAQQVTLPDFIRQFKEIGVFDFYLPFLIFFGILYGILIKTKVFGEGKGVPAIISLAAAAFIMLATPVGITISQFLANFAAATLVVILTLVVIIIITSFLVSGEIIPKLSEVFTAQTRWPVVFILLVALVAFGIFIASGGTAIFPGIKILPRELFGTIAGLSPAVWAIIVIIVGIGLVVIFSKPAEERRAQRPVG